MNRSPWRLEEVDGGDEQYPVESRFVVGHTPPDEQDPRFDRSAPTQVRFLRFAVRHTPPDQQDPRFDRRRSVSSVVRYARPCFHRLFRSSPPDEHDQAFRSDPAALPPHEHDAFRCLPMNTTTTLFLRSDPAMYTSPARTYARLGVRDPARMYTYVAVFSFLHPGRCTYVCMLRARLYYDTGAPLHRPVYMYVHFRDQNDNTTYASTRWVPTVTHFLACEDVAGWSQQSGGRN